MPTEFQPADMIAQTPAPTGKWSPEILARVHARYRLRDDGLLENAKTGVVRPRMDSAEAQIFKDFQKVMVVDVGAGGWGLRVGAIVTARIYPSEPFIVRVRGVAYHPGRFDPLGLDDLTDAKESE